MIRRYDATDRQVAAMEATRLSGIASDREFERAAKDATPLGRRLARRERDGDPDEDE